MYTTSARRMEITSDGMGLPKALKQLLATCVMPMKPMLKGMM